MDDGNKDVDESSEPSSTGPLFLESLESSLAEDLDENDMPISIDTSNDEEEQKNITSLPSTTRPKLMLK